MKKSRIITTFDCPRKCPNCCNNYSSIINRGTRTDNLIDCVEGFDRILLTGGEPMMFPKRIKQIVKDIRAMPSNKTIFLYTALLTPETLDIIDIVDGIQYSVHAEAISQDIEDFHRFQEMIADKSGSYRAYISPKVKHNVIIKPNRWARLEIKPWIMEGACKLPKDETLFILTGYDETDEALVLAEKALESDKDSIALQAIVASIKKRKKKLERS